MVFLSDRNSIVMAVMGIVGCILVVASTGALVRALREEAPEERKLRERPRTTPPPAPEDDPPPPPARTE
jgi:hypothetical protein